MERLLSLADLLKSADQPFAIGYADGRILDCNDAFCELAGYTREELKGLNWSANLTPPEWRQIDKDMLVKHGESEEPLRYEKVIFRKDGTRISVRLSMHMLCDENHKPIFYYMFVNDITGQRRPLVFPQELLGNMEMFRQLFDMAQEGVWAIDRDLKTSNVNLCMADMLGYTVEEMTGQSIFDFMAKNKKKLFMERMDKPRFGVVGKYDFEFIRKDGTCMYANLMAVSFKDNSGRYAGGLAFITDMTARRKIEHALSESEKIYQKIIETANEGIWIVDMNGHTIIANKKMAELLGCTLDEINKIKGLNYVFEEDVEKAWDLWQQAISGTLEHFEFRFKKRDGSLVWMQVSITPLYDDDYIFSGLLAMFTDITRYKLAEISLVESKVFLDDLFQSINLPIFVVDVEDGDYRIIDVNPAFEKNARMNMGLTKDLCAGLTLCEIEKRLSLPTGSFNLMRVNFDKCVKKGKPLQYETHDPSSGEYWFMSLTPLRNDKGRIHRIVGNLMNITKIKQAEKELIEARRQSELYLDLMGHDINNMHQVALGYLELISTGGLDKDTRDLLKKPYEALQKSSKIIDNVRKLQKIKTEEVKKEAIDIERLLNETIKDYQGIQGKTIRIHTNDGTGFKINANDLLRDVFDNLIGNAIKHSSGKDVEILISLDETWIRNKPYVRIAVEDNGPGIPNKAKRKIFNRMQRGETKASGMGLGLYLARSLVESYNGRIWVEDRVEGDHTKGSKFMVIIPAMKG